MKSKVLYYSKEDIYLICDKYKNGNNYEVYMSTKMIVDLIRNINSEVKMLNQIIEDSIKKTKYSKYYIIASVILSICFIGKFHCVDPMFWVDLIFPFLGLFLYNFFKLKALSAAMMLKSIGEYHEIIIAGTT